MSLKTDQQGGDQKGLKDLKGPKGGKRETPIGVVGTAHIISHLMADTKLVQFLFNLEAAVEKIDTPEGQEHCRKVAAEIPEIQGCYMGMMQDAIDFAERSGIDLNDPNLYGCELSATGTENETKI